MPLRPGCSGVADPGRWRALPPAVSPPSRRSPGRARRRLPPGSTLSPPHLKRSSELLAGDVLGLVPAQRRPQQAGRPAPVQLGRAAALGPPRRGGFAPRRDAPPPGGDLASGTGRGPVVG